MIGLGTWEIPVNSMLYKGTAYVIVSEKNGAYDFQFQASDLRLPEFDIYNVTVNGDTLSADATCAQLRGKSLHADVTFQGDACTGAVKAPMGITIRINGRRVG